MPQVIECPISGEAMAHAFSETLLGKYQVAYYHCAGCGLLKTEPPYWLDEAYRDAINDCDTGILARNHANAELVEIILEALALENGRVLDIAGGYGLLTRLLRDKGFDAYSTDKYCSNLFAKRFEPTAGFKADALLAFEVLEHVEDPVAFVQEAFSRYQCRTLVFSTLTFSGAVPPRKWWYYLFGTGQHITFYQSRTLAALARRLGCSYYMVSNDLHVFTGEPVPLPRRWLFLRESLRTVYGRYLRHKRRGLSKTWSDHLEA
ncbi:hypothetical protein RD110_13005 [Rhodoferax koreense]|uniref:Methyltransferase type 11 n=1 Tax=Rhodoferax koreensis TaxID=1842727 RepID=A0A1P8JW52_9BURK|nr:class I SAM-dependent methyltransferase [Rhodoferax koreense]APW37999.1 hypothetical protein RD110_13005 [Rhodoferax koreense]